jgi:phosphoserine phosphatase RsbU/P
MRRMNMYVTVFYSVLDTERNVLTYANAGHPPPILRRGDRTEELEGYGVPLGLTPDSDYEDGTLVLQPGDALVLYSATPMG